MEVATSLNIFARYPLPVGFARMAAAGFRTIDFNYNAFRERLLEQTEEEERRWAEGVREEAARHGIRLAQMHAPIYNPFGGTPESEALNDLTARSMRTAAVLGVPWVVVHPGSVAGAWDETHRRTLRERCVAYVRGLLDASDGLPVGVAMENCTSKEREIAAAGEQPAGMRPRELYGATAEELLEILDASSGGDRVGVCWDFGHAQVQGVDQGQQLRLLGSRLKVTHVHDNDGRSDQHLLPFNGKVDWTSVMSALKSIGYAGPFSLEVHNAFHPLPDALKDHHLRFAHRVATYLVEQAG